MKRAKFAWVFWLVLLAGAPTFALAQAPITKTQSRSLPPQVVTQRIFAQLARQMRFEPWPKGLPKPKLRLSDMQFWTVPRATDVAGLCESSLVTVYFDPAGPDRGANTKVSASGLNVDHVFHFLSEPTSLAPGTLGQAARLKLEQSCGQLKPDNFFHAPGDVAAMYAANAFQNMVGAARDDAPLPFSCKDGNASIEGCRRDLAKLKFANITDIRPCTDLDDGMECQEVWLSNDGLSVTIRSSNAGATIKKVDVGIVVTTGDARQD